MKIKIIASVVLLSLGSAQAFASKAPAFSMVCKSTSTAVNAPVYAFAGSAVKKGFFFPTWDMIGVLSYQDSSNNKIKLTMEAAQLIPAQIGFQFRTMDSAAGNTPNVESTLTIFIPQGLGEMPAGPLEFTTAADKSTNIDIVNSTNNSHIFTDPAAQLHCAWTKTQSTKPSWLGEILDGAGTGLGESLFGGGGN